VVGTVKSAKAQKEKGKIIRHQTFNGFTWRRGVRCEVRKTPNFLLRWFGVFSIGANIPATG
jgi:hypothetical protein